VKEVGDSTTKDTFSSAELSALRNDLLQGVQIDSREAAELLQVFLMGRGYGASPAAVVDAMARVEMSGCSMPVLQRELEALALRCERPAIEIRGSMPTVSVVQILTASIAPVIVISGVGLLLLSITNRYGRVIDRARLLARDLAESDPESARRRHLNDQLRFTNRRAHMLRSSMLYASTSIFFVSLTVLSLFAEQLLQLHKDLIALPFFALCLISLVVSMYYSIRDITVSLAALDLEVSERLRGGLHLP